MGDRRACTATLIRARLVTGDRGCRPWPTGERKGVTSVRCRAFPTHLCMGLGSEVDLTATRQVVETKPFVYWSQVPVHPVEGRGTAPTQGTGVTLGSKTR